MAYEYKEPDVVETHHTTRETVVQDTGSSAGWAVVLVLAVLVVLGLVGYFAFAGGDRGADTTQVRVETPASERAQDIKIDAPDVNVAPPNVTIEPPIINTPPPTTEGGTTESATTGN